jgi:hypothetical protein
MSDRSSGFGNFMVQKDGKYYVYYSNALDLYGHGLTKEDAKKSFMLNSIQFIYPPQTSYCEFNSNFQNSIAKGLKPKSSMLKPPYFVINVEEGRVYADQAYTTVAIIDNNNKVIGGEVERTVSRMDLSQTISKISCSLLVI